MVSTEQLRCDIPERVSLSHSYVMHAGTVKRFGVLKIVHEKFKVKKKHVEQSAVEFHSSFVSALEYDKDLEALLSQEQVQ
jgi:hypothetical protein